MKRRILSLLLALTATALPAAAEEKPYRVTLVGDAYDGKAWHTGVLVELAPGWKTYWRMPGESGVAPEFTWKSSVPADVRLAYPTPSRHADASGEAVGYAGEVLFPVTVEARGAARVELGLGLFFGVCKDVCIPARAEAAITLGPQMRDPHGSARVMEAEQAVPVPGEAVTGAEVTSEGGKPVLLLTLTERPEDIFVETASSAYFAAPRLSEDGRQARLVIGNLSDPARLAGQSLRLTYRIGAKGYEQSVTLP